MENTSAYEESFEREEDPEWLYVNAIRQTFGLAQKGNITYSDAVNYAYLISPELFSPNSPLLGAYEKEVVKLYRERAAGRSRLIGKEVSPLQLINEDIQKYSEELEKAPSDKRNALLSELGKLQRGKIQLETSAWTEDKVIHRDADSPEKDYKVAAKGQGYKIFRISSNRVLNVKVFHPDHKEHITGVDLVYETYYNKREENRTTLLVRIAVLQYKMWDGKTLYTSKAINLLNQMEKMKKAFCDLGFCEQPQESENDKERYRLPFCCAFLRPTDKVQTKDAWQVSHAWHVPICSALDRVEETPEGKKVIRSKMIRSCALTQDTFQELYTTNMLGSRFMRADKLKELYQKLGLFDDVDKIIVHAQEN